MAIKTAIEILTEVTLANASASLAFPAAAGDGADISLTTAVNPLSAGRWKEVGASHVDACVFVKSSAAQVLSGGIGVYGFLTDTATWYFLGALNNGTAIATLGATTGYAQMIDFCGMFARIAVGPLTAAAVTPSVGTVTITACQVRQIPSS